MKLDQPLKTPFGNLETHASIYQGVFGLTLNGNVKVNRIDYQVSMEVKYRDGEWKRSSLRLDRADKKEAAFPHNARDKFEDAVLAMLPDYVTEEVVAATEEEKRLKDIAEEEYKITKAEETIRYAKERLAQLRNHEPKG